MQRATTNSNGFDDSQLDWLVGERDASLDLVEDAVAWGRLLLLPTEAFGLAMVLFERLFPTDFRYCAYGRKINASAYAPDRDEVAERDAAAGLPWIESDHLLHRLAWARLEKTASNVFGTISAAEGVLADFRKHCESRHQSHSSKWVKHTWWRRIESHRLRRR